MYKRYGKFIGLHTCGFVQYVFNFWKSAGSHKMCETRPVLNLHEIDEEDDTSVVKLMTPAIISKDILIKVPQELQNTCQQSHDLLPFNICMRY